MRILIHGLKSLIRRPAKTGMLFVILFVVFNLIFSGFIIQNSIARSKEYIRNQIGGVVEYRMDYTSLMSAGRPTNGQNMTSIPPLSLSIAAKMADSPYVDAYYVVESANISAETISPAETQSSSTGGFQRDFSDFTFSGTSQADSLDFVMGNVTLSDGRTLSADDVKNGTAVVIISEDVAETNNLVVGDTISLAVVSQSQMRPGDNQGSTGSTTTATYSDYEVIGIYKAVEDGFNVNTMFTSDEVIYNLNGTSGSDDTSGTIVFMLDSAENVDAFITDMTPYLTSEYHTLYSDDSTYTSLTKPLNLLSFITSILIWVVFIAGAAIIIALVTIFVRDRKFEIGLLLSSGEGRIKIVGQFVFEMLVIAILAFTISVASSSVISKGVSAWIVDNELLSQTSLIGSTSSSTTTGSQMGNFGRFGQSSVSLYGAVDMEGVAEQFDVAVNAAVVGELMLSSIILVLIGSAVPLSIIMGYKPRRILQDDN